MDNSGVAPTVVQSHSQGEVFPVGTTDVAYIYSDGSGNTATCVFTVRGANFDCNFLLSALW